MFRIMYATVAATLLATAIAAQAEVKVTTAHNEGSGATRAFHFKDVPGIARDDAATQAKFTIIEGDQDGNSDDIDALNDGNAPIGDDHPESNFFFDHASDGGRILCDLGKVIPIASINTYSWHPDTRGPQVYTVWVSDGTAKDFNKTPKRGTDPEKVGWKKVAVVDSRPKGQQGGGQYGVSITDTTGTLASARYVLFDIVPTEKDDADGNTFYSEIDIHEKK